jgi:hypothetical protein
LPSEIEFLQAAVSADSRDVNIRLREGEYQYGLVKVIAAFQLELCFPDVRDIIRRTYGDEKANDIQFVRKIQTILKKLEKSGIVRILPKKRPWELQRYGVEGFRFRDSDRNVVVLAAAQQFERARNLLRSRLSDQATVKVNYLKLCMFMSITLLSYAAVAWALFQPIINPLVFVPALSASVVCSIWAGKLLSQR